MLLNIILPLSEISMPTILEKIVCFLVCLSAFAVQAQSGLKVHAGPLYAHNYQNLSLGEDEIESSGFGYFTGLDFVLQPEKWKFQPGIGVGYKKVYTNGTVAQYDISGESSKITGLLFCHYLISENWGVGIVGMVENNTDFGTFRLKASDQWRFNAGLELLYETDMDLGAFLRYTRSIYPNENIYLIINPSDQIFLGFFYKFL